MRGKLTRARGHGARHALDTNARPRLLTIAQPAARRKIRRSSRFTAPISVTCAAMSGGMVIPAACAVLRLMPR